MGIELGLVLQLLAALARREGMGGLEEKALRKAVKRENGEA